ncbi:hypothetical protein ACGFYU_36555 [Streptomyces sp. NPDC048337]|uniref:hypothetical protein n=1 Tax=Streptomyces sp. NPDC048337 TaxID=3365535 RepID=UPI003712F6E0
MHARHFAPLLLICCLSLISCGGGNEEPKASDSPPPTAAEIAYYDCLKDNGVKLTHTDYGAPRVDKDDPSAKEKLPAAQEACKDKVPPAPSAPPADPKRLAAARAESKCLRGQGVPWYPDPDLVTGNIDEQAITPEQAVELRTKHMDAMRKCRTSRGSDNAVLGG